jgi:hypothetical protein
MPQDESSKPATKGDLTALEGRIDARMDARLAALENRLLEAVRDSQTEVLRGFERYAAAE